MTVWSTCSQYSELDRVALLYVECPVICQMQQLLVAMVTTHGPLSVFSCSLCRRKAVGGRTKWRWWWGQIDCMLLSAWNKCEEKWESGSCKEGMDTSVGLTEAKLLTVPLCFEWPVSALSRGCTPNRCCTDACAWPTRGTAGLKEEKTRGGVSVPRQGQNQQVPVHQSSVKLCCRDGAVIVWLSLKQARWGQMDPEHCQTASSVSAQVTPVHCETNGTSQPPDTRISRVHFSSKTPYCLLNFL